MDITVTSTIFGFGTIPTTNSATATYNGVTFTFDTPMPVGYYDSGEPFVVSSSAFNITAISPASQLIDATYWGHGAMQDPYCDTEQGFDQIIANGSSPTGSSTTAYNASLNVDPAVGGNIAIAQGEETSIVKSVRKSGATISMWQSIEKYVTLTVVASAPAPGAVMPAPSELGQKTHYNLADIDLSVTRSVTMPSSFLTSVPTASDALALVPDYLGTWGESNGERRRRFRLDADLGSDNYSASLIEHHARAILHLHNSTTTKAQKYSIAERVLRHGAQVIACVDRGTTYAGIYGGAGQGGALSIWAWAMAFLLKDSSVLAKINATRFMLTGSSHWLTSSLLTQTPNTRSAETPQPVLADQVGLPEVSGVGMTTNIESPYKNIAATIIYWEAMCLLPFYNWGGEDWTAKLTGGVHDTTNDKAAVIAFLDRARTWDNIFNAYNFPAELDDLYDTLRSNSSMSTWTGQPEQMPYANHSATSYDDDYFAAGAGSISWDFKSLNFATEAVTRRDFRYSLDGIQWVTVSDVATTGSQTGLLRGATHWCGLRQASASGDGEWSKNFPYYNFVDVNNCEDLTGTTPSLVPGNHYWVLTGASTPTDGFGGDNDATLWIENSGNHAVTWPTITWVGNGGVEPVLKSGLNLIVLEKDSGVLYGYTDRGLSTPTGTDTAAAPVNTVAPKIFVRTYEFFEYPFYEEATSPLGSDESAFLVAGAGYWTGYPAPALTYQWKRDGTPIGGATSARYQRTAADAGADLTCEVTATNASGSAAQTTAAITMPALATIPAGTLIDTNFGSSFLVDYETEWTGRYTSNGVSRLTPGYGGDIGLNNETNDIVDLSALNRGAIWVDKTDGTPFVNMTLSRAVTPGSSYRIQAQLYSPPDDWSGGKFRFDLVYDVGPYSPPLYSYLDQGAADWSGAALQVLEAGMDPATDGTTTYNEATYRGTVTRTGHIIDIDITFDVASDESDLYPVIYFGHRTSTGGTSGGDPYLTYLKISEAV